jgi:Protein kinase domain
MSGLTTYAPQIDSLDNLISAAPGDAVWLARHRASGVDVRVIILDDPRLPADVVRRATRESRLLAGQKTHAALVQIAEVIDMPGGIVAVATEHHPLGSLGRIIAKSGAVGGHEVAWIGREAALALATLHEHRIVHLRISPGAILLTNDRRVSLGSFGALGEVEHRLDLVGSHLSWVAPEQSDSPAADVYALGATLLTALTGRTPGPRPSLHGVPAVMRPVFFGALHPDPSQRPSAVLLAAQITAVMEGADPAEAMEPARRVAPATVASTDIDGATTPKTTRGKMLARRWGARPITVDAPVIDLRDNATDLTPGYDIDLRRLPTTRSFASTTAGTSRRSAAPITMEVPATRFVPHVSDRDIDDAAPLDDSSRVRPMVKVAALTTALIAAVIGAMAVSSFGRDNGPDPLLGPTSSPAGITAQPRQPATDGLAQIGAVNADGIVIVEPISPIIDPVTGLAVPIDPAPIGQQPTQDPRPTAGGIPADQIPVISTAPSVTSAAVAVSGTNDSATDAAASDTVPEDIVLPTIMMDPAVVKALTDQKAAQTNE